MNIIPCHKTRKEMTRALKLFDNLYKFKIKNPTINASKSPLWTTHNFPTNFTISSTDKCNLSCPGCVKNARRSGELTFPLFKRMVNSINSYTHIDRLTLEHRGEPLLNKNICDFVNYAKLKGAKFITFSTNLNIRDKNILTNLERSQLDGITVALDGATKKTYEKFRKGGNFECVIENLKRLAKSSIRKFNITIQFIPNKYNEHELGKIKALARTIGAEYLRIRILDLKPSDMSLLPRNKRFRYDYTKNLDLNALKKPFLCNDAYSHMLIDLDGSVYPCCYYAEDWSFLGVNKKECVFGNIFTDDLKTIWLSNKYYKFRRSFLENLATAVCKFCLTIKQNKPKQILTKVQ